MSETQHGRLYGVGLGPGDPELVTIKAAKVLAAVPVVAFFAKQGSRGKARAILAYLVLSPGGSATREQLAGLLWSDRGQDQARASLRQSLKELRELPAIGDTIATERDAVALDPAAVTVDLHEIRHAAGARDLPALAGLLEQPTRESNGPDRSFSLLGFASGGVCRADESPHRWCALTAPFHPYPAP